MSEAFAKDAERRARDSQTDTSAEAVDLIEQSSKRQHFTDVRHVSVRWEPYKPDGARQMKRKGRWQEQVGSGDYWSWQNCERPAFAHDPDAEVERDALQAQLAKAVEALHEIAGKKDYADDPWGIARAILAELKGENDE